MKHYSTPTRRGPYFEGWYLKHQWQEGEFAVIPAVHQGKRGRREVTIQVITQAQVRQFSFPESSFELWPNLFQLRVGDNWFSQDGIRLDLEDGDFSLKGELRYGPFSPLRSDIMGPFRYVPFLQCRHGVLSMGHRVDGLLAFNGSKSIITNGMGYIETDCGRSFPKRYLWTQCCWRERQHGSLMLSIAHIPLPAGGFTGCICQVLFAGRSYRLATYRGVKIKRWDEAGAELCQGELRLTADLLEGSGQPLRAPVSGQLVRAITESLRATVRYRFWEGERLVFDHVDGRASFEYADGDGGDSD